MTFAWEGFWFSHPEEWAPAAMSGNRDEGYVRIASGGRIACQVRWKSAPADVNLSRRLDDYFKKLRKDSRSSFDSGTEEAGSQLRYHYSGTLNGKGAIFYDVSTERVFFIELSSPKNDRLGTPLKAILGSFGSGKERWAAFGLDVTLPQPIKLEKKAFLSGKTQLMFGRRGTTVDIQRWAFGEQLLQRHDLESWSRAVMGMRRAIADVKDGEVRLTQRFPLFPTTHGLSVFQADRNQLITIKVRTRLQSWEPTCDWLN